MEKTNEINEFSVYKRLSQKLYDLFFVDEYKYGRQVDNGSYRLIKAKVSPVTIDDMLLNGKSLLTYQESHSLQTAFIKWVCLDLDLDRKKMRLDAVGNNDEQDTEVSVVDLQKVKEAADQVSAYLTGQGIPHLQEFSGRRGFHIWIIFEVPVTKEQGYQLAKLITTKVKLDESVNIDLFPKTHYVAKNSKGIGSGVKLPLSVHKRSGNLSYLLKAGAFDFNDYKFSKLSEEFMERQLQLLDELQLVGLVQINPLLEEYGRLAKVSPAISRPYLTKSNFKVGDAGANLDLILESLKGCDHLRETILNYRKELNPKERNTFVGLLAQLTTASDPNFGYKLLLEFFSRVSGFRKDLTEQKLRLSKYYYPVTCASLGRCEACKCSELRSPIELHKDIQILPKPLFSIENIKEDLFPVIVEAEVKYTKINDEIPLYNRLEKLQKADFEQVSRLIAEIFDGKFPPVNETFHFERNEIDKVRNLYAVEPLHALVSTYFLYLLNNMFYTEISPNSYGYRIAPGFYNGNIFGNWFINWGAFSKSIQRVLENEEYASYFLVKVDIRNFYDRIDLQLLKIKLYEEALPTIDQRIKSLPEDERKRYLNIVKFLIHLSEQTVRGTTGLPQGPAYARYLAEFYLLGLDKMIEEEIIRDRRREYYYRFVDDIFIFVETEAKAKEVLEKVRDWSMSNALDLNPNKTELSSVSDYSASGKFKKFQEDAKYAINQGNKNKELLSEEERHEVIAKVERLTDETKFGLKDNLRFFYYHFSADERLTHVKDKITRMLPFSDNGRGTLYMLLYADLFESKREMFWALAQDQEKINGLSLGHYLNTILLNFEHIQDKGKIVSELLLGLSKRSDLSYADKSLILTLAMKFNIQPPAKLLNMCPEKLIFSVMETPNLEYNESNYDLLTKMLESKQEVDFIDTLYEVIHQHTLSPGVAVELANYALTRFATWKGRTELTSKLINTDIALKYYHCICFLTLFDRNNNPAPVATSWEILLSLSKEIDLEGKPITFAWISNAIKIFSGKLSASAFALLLGDRSGSKLNVFNCTNNFIPQYKDILLIFYFEKGTLSTEMMDKKDEVIDRDTLFGEWLFSPQTRLYPSSRDICVRNLALNGLIVLENDHEIFIKNINGHLQHDHFSYLEVKAKLDDSEIVIAKNGINGLPIFKPAGDLVELAINIGKQIQADIEFKDTFVAEYPVYYNFPFQKDGKPLIPFYSTFVQKVSNEAINQNNDVKSYWENLLFIASLRNDSLKLLDQPNHPFNFTFKELSDRLIPKSEIFIRTEQDRLDFMMAFSREAEGKPIKSIYDFQYLWLKVVWDTISGRSKTNVRAFLQFLHVHFGTSNGGQLAAADVLFGIDSNSKVEDQTLEDLRLTIRNSFVSFQSNILLADFNVVELFDAEMRSYKGVLPEGTGLVDFKKTKLTIRKAYNSQTGKEETQVMLEKDDLSNFQFMVYDTDNLKFYCKKLEELNSSLSGRLYYMHNAGQEVFIIPIELQISNAFNRIEERYKVYKLVEKNGGDFSLTFPSSDAYVKAQQTFDQYKAAEIEAILKNHYANGTEIRARIVNWLNFFNASSLAGSKTLAFLEENGYGISDLHRSVLEVLSQHIAITDEDLAFFYERITREQESGSVVFAIKDPRTDGNGLARLLEKVGFGLRDVDFDASYATMTSGSLAGKCLVIATDISVSGTQSLQGLNYYNNVPETEEDLIKLRERLVISNERYFKFSNLGDFEKCKTNFLEAAQIKFISPISTETFRDKIQDHPLLGLNKHIIESNRIILNKSYNLSGVIIDDNSRQIFYTLVKDIDLINSLFIIKDGYSKSVRDPGENNVLLRVRSLPKEHIRLFSLESKNGRLSLLDYVPNWKSSKKEKKD